MSLRFRSEAIINPLAQAGPPGNKSYAAGVNLIVPALPGLRVGIYRLVLQSGAGSTIQFADTQASPVGISAVYTFPSAGSFLILDVPINNDPWWQTGLGLGLNLIVGVAPVVMDLWYLQTV
jgi:hypothetical protein